ncbi:hypothetical protein ACFX2J_031822 [Malus domestica]
MLDTEPAHYTLRAKDSLTANSSDRLASSLLSLEVTRFLATTAAVISFFITESPTVRGPVRDMKDERHMLSSCLFTKVQVKTTIRRARHFSEVVKKEEVEQVKIVEMQRGSF